LLECRMIIWQHLCLKLVQGLLCLGRVQLHDLLLCSGMSESCATRALRSMAGQTFPFSPTG
jgi:hypothetical protein